MEDDEKRKDHLRENLERVRRRWAEVMREVGAMGFGERRRWKEILGIDGRKEQRGTILQEGAGVGVSKVKEQDGGRRAGC